MKTIISHLKKQFILVSKVLVGQYPENNPPTWFMRLLMAFLILIRLLSICQYIKIFWTDKEKQNDIVDIYKCISLIGLVVLLLYFPTTTVALVITIYLLSDMYVVTLGVILVDRYDPEHTIRSPERSAVLLFLGYLEVIIGFAILYLYSNSLVFNLNENHQPVTLAKDALYFSTVTITTLGYGDILPISDIGKNLVIIETLVGISLIVYALAIFVLSTKALNEHKEIKNNNTN